MVFNPWLYTWSGDDIRDEFVFKEYIRHFPEIELNSKESISSYRKFSDQGAEYHTIGLFSDDQECIGGCYYWHFADINAIVIEFIFVSEAHRGMGHADRMIGSIKTKFPNCPILVEVDKGSNAEPFWSHYGFHKSDYEYTQPPILEGNQEYGGLPIWVDSDSLDIDEVLKNHYFKYAFA